MGEVTSGASRPQVEIDVRTSDGRVWTAWANSIPDFENTLRNFRYLNVGVPGAASPSGWRVATAHVVAWRRDD